jgi:hypothetical protein
VRFSYPTQSPLAGDEITPPQGVQHIKGASKETMQDFEWAVSPSDGSSGEMKDYVCSFPKHTCPSDTLHHDGSCYWIIEKPMGFIKAGAACAKTAAEYNTTGNLASVHTTSSFQFVADMLGNEGVGWQGDGKGAWIGLNDRVTEGHFTYADGTLSAYGVESHAVEGEEGFAPPFALHQPGLGKEAAHNDCVIIGHSVEDCLEDPSKSCPKLFPRPCSEWSPGVCKMEMPGVPIGAHIGIGIAPSFGAG